MDELPLASTTPFYTLDACNGDLAESIVLALHDENSGIHDTWKNLVESDSSLNQRLISQGIDKPKTRSEIDWDDSTLLAARTPLATENRPGKQCFFSVYCRDWRSNGTRFSSSTI